MDTPLEPGKYKKTKSDTTSNAKPQLFLVEKNDGSIGQWGNDLKEPAKPIPVSKKKALLSEKARGLSNTYMAPRDQQKGPDVPVQRKSNNYY